MKRELSENISQPTLYTCSHPWLLGRLGKDLFPEYNQEPLLEADPALYTEQDIIISHPGFNCDNKMLNGHPDLRTSLKKSNWNFPGKILYINGESYMDPRGTLDYHLGHLPDSDRSIRVFWVFISFLYGPSSYYPSDVISQIYQTRRSPIKTIRGVLQPPKKKYFLIYAASNCKMHREAAFDALTHVNTVHYAGACHGLLPKNEKVQPAPKMEKFSRAQQGNNRALFEDYRYCLVMENKKVDGYISEKILTAFFSGCVPIWYGTTEIFDLFNKESFIYYDVDHPWVAINKIKDLEANPSKYEEMLMQPILAHGADTVNKYMSFGSGIGNGELRKRIHNMMGLPGVLNHSELEDQKEID
eukprot:CAMPEP_0195529374 /NCGR_PEP_ID=MMETSP0794_2-20130614/31879_1 /TAXON_ID=515487 /ORGANISM="Stephanopyxis turris, Strain CCMP 815" /LENGTH=357 /DNA_ID=CAMNT_0040660669 /DNA_START=239 /DNA_END=1312 /DNA_ORIENTATION=+